MRTSILFGGAIILCCFNSSFIVTAGKSGFNADGLLPVMVNAQLAVDNGGLSNHDAKRSKMTVAHTQDCFNVVLLNGSTAGNAFLVSAAGSDVLEPVRPSDKTQQNVIPSINNELKSHSQSRLSAASAYAIKVGRASVLITITERNILKVMYRYFNTFVP